jgi:hypothetical protein
VPSKTFTIAAYNKTPETTRIIDINPNPSSSGTFTLPSPSSLSSLIPPPLQKRNALNC